MLTAVPPVGKADRWHGHAEPLGEQCQVVSVGGAERVAEMVADLQLGGEAADLPAPTGPAPGPPPRRVRPPGPTPHPLPAISVRVEARRMQVALPAAGANQDQ